MKKGLSIDWCKNCDKGLPKPDIVFFLDIDEKKVSERGNFGEEIYEKVEFQAKVKEKYEELKEKDWEIINAKNDIEEIHEFIMQKILNYVEENDTSTKIEKLWI